MGVTFTEVVSFCGEGKKDYQVQNELSTVNTGENRIHAC